MSQSVLLSVARQSIEEVLRAESLIDRSSLLERYPVLAQTMATAITLYLDNKVRGKALTQTPHRSLLEDIIHNAKIAAFEDTGFSALSTSEYLYTSIELTLFSPEGPLSHRDEPILKET